MRSTAVASRAVRHFRRGPAASSAAAAAASPPPSPATPLHPITFHEDMAINPIPDGHRFPMPKDALLHQRLQREGLGRTFAPALPDLDTLCLAHDRAFVESFLSGSISAQEMRRVGLPWSQQLVRRTLVGVGSAVLAARLAVQLGLAVMCNGGTHHAHPAHGSGWCIFNDQAVAARAAQRDLGIGQCLFVDLDVHQGDGTAAIFAGDPSAFTLSLHCAQQPFPHRLQRSDLDVALPAGAGDEEYLAALQRVLPPLLARLRPELVLYNAGVDVHRDDTLGLLALSDEGILARDRFVLAACAEHGAPVAAAIGGGYSPDHGAIVDRHMLLHRAAAEAFPLMAARCSSGGRATAAAERQRRQRQGS